jgi:hypothetical protein
MYSAFEMQDTGAPQERSGCWVTVQAGIRTSWRVQHIPPIIVGWTDGKIIPGARPSNCAIHRATYGGFMIGS